MVRVSGRGSRATAGGATISGGFVLVSVASLMTVWRACQSRPLGMGGFRTWLACHEMVSRRCTLAKGRAPGFDLTELARLLHVTDRRAKDSVRRLVAAGLMEWSGSSIIFPPQPSIDGRLDDGRLEDTLGRGKGWVAIPRRMLRHLATARPALIATALGAMLRCVSRRRSGWTSYGRIKAAWVAEAFQVDVRAVKRARRELVALGWLAEVPTPPWSVRRYGAAYRVDLGWRSTLPPVPLSAGATLPPPDQTLIPLGKEKDQEPASGGPAGIQLGAGEDHPSKPDGRTQPPGHPGPQPGDSKLPPPQLEDVRPEDLSDVARTLELHRQAVVKGLIGGSEADRLRFVALAEHSRVVGKVPGALFASLLARGAWKFITQAEEDSARRRIKHHEFGGREGMASPIGSFALWPSRESSEDGRIVRQVRAATIRAGIYRDPWPAFQRLNPGWTRARWDAAVLESRAD